MSDKVNNELSNEEMSDKLLKQLLHLKNYERPELSRMTKNKQNIFRQVREMEGQKRWSLGDILEVNLPWFFAEPRYGIALLFIAFAALQYWDESFRKKRGVGSEFYVASDNISTYEYSDNAQTNNLSYPSFPTHLKLFSDVQPVNNMVKPVSNFKEKE